MFDQLKTSLPSLLINYVTSCKADVFALTDTWLSENDDAHRAEITPTGFKLIDHSRNNRCGGGTALLFRRNLNVQNIAAKELRSFEYLELIVSLFDFIAHPIRLRTLSPQAPFWLTLQITCKL